LKQSVLNRLPISVATIVGVIALGSLFLAISGAQLAAQPGFTPTDEEPKNYPEGAGRDETFYACTSCHTFKLVAQQGITREQWNESLNWMTERHKMPEITGADREVILGYLSTHYAPKEKAGGRAWKSPFSP